MLDMGRKVDVISGLFALKLVNNPGAAFGFFGSWPPLLILIGVAAVFAVIVLRRERDRSKVLAVAMGLLLGGAFGNLIDRLVLGPVTDFLDFGVNISGRTLSWPTFNIADTAIVVGVFLLVYHTLFLEKEQTGDEATVSPRINS